MDAEKTLIINTADRTILRYLYRSFGIPLSLFQLHNDYRFSPGQLGSFVAKLGEIGIIDLHNEYISLTDLGKKWLISHRNKIFYSHVQYDWREIPKEMRKREIDIDSLYLPKKSSLGKHFLEDV
jgi:hypothetical protein